MSIDFFEGLNKEEIKTLGNQINRFEEMSNYQRKAVNISDDVILPKGTLIHGTLFDKKMLSSIAQTGIITGQYFGIEEDGETYYCADFHKTFKDISLSEYNNWFPYRDGRCPFGKFGKDQVAFLLFPDDRAKDIMSYDCYGDSNDSNVLITQNFVNMAGLPMEDRNLCSSILFGVPNCFINGIVVGDDVISEDNISFLIDKFPNTFIVRNNGQFLYKVGDNEEIRSLRVKNASESILCELQKGIIDQKDAKINSLQESEQNLWSAIAKLPVDQIAGIYKSLGWQGDYEEYAMNLKEKYKDDLNIRKI